MNLAVHIGKPYPLGATWDGTGVNFSLYSENADGVELCLFQAEEDEYETVKIRLKERTHNIWHAYIPNIMPGQLYGYRVIGQYDPPNGKLFNVNKLLIDPYAKAVSGTIQWHDALFGYDLHHPDKVMKFNAMDSAPYIPRSIVVDTTFDWEGDKRPDIPYHETIIYELHVKGFTKLQSKLPESIRGTYKALAHPDTIAYFKSLGITAIELMPVHHYVSDRTLYEKGLVNYWGYNTIGFFAPDIRYSSDKAAGAQVREFKEMVKALHKAGLEIILDVVYNHTAEGNENGPTLSFRGIDNESYYRLCDNKMHYMDYTGTGNTFNARMPNVLRLIMDSLRYWVEEMHIDGFRFDLASALARELHEVDRLSAFFDIIHQDPVISQVKLIAEPWDVGEGGYQVGKFPPGWAEWNGMYRDCVRGFWKGSDNMLGEFALRFTGSPDLYENDFRRPTASINFITAHDGYTLHDLVSYKDKHNFANHEDNKDGDNHNLSENYGVEGPCNDATINKIRSRQKRNFFTTLFLSQGVPMILGGDEFGRTQKGNNNAYCQDNEISWVDWNNPDTELSSFVQQLIAFWKAHPAFSRRRWFEGKPIRGVGLEDIVWFLPNGCEMDEQSWQQNFAKSLGIFINGLGLRCVDDNGTKMTDDNFYLIFNAHDEPLNFVLPSDKYGTPWSKVLDTYEGSFYEIGVKGHDKQHEHEDQYEPGNQREHRDKHVSTALSNLISEIKVKNADSRNGAAENRIAEKPEIGNRDEKADAVNFNGGKVDAGNLNGDIVDAVNHNGDMVDTGNHNGDIVDAGYHKADHDGAGNNRSDHGKSEKNNVGKIKGDPGETANKNNRDFEFEIVELKSGETRIAEPKNGEIIVGSVKNRSHKIVPAKVKTNKEGVPLPDQSFESRDQAIPGAKVSADGSVIKDNALKDSLAKTEIGKRGPIQYRAKDVIKVEGRSIIVLMHTHHVDAPVNTMHN